MYLYKIMSSAVQWAFLWIDRSLGERWEEESSLVGSLWTLALDQQSAAVH